MNQNYPDPSDEMLDAAFSAVRDRPIPDGPSDELMAQTIGAMHAAAVRRPNIFRRLGDRTLMARIAAVVLVAAGGLIIVSLLFRSTAMTMGDIVEKVRGAHTMSLLMNSTIPQAGAVQMKIMMNDQGQACFEGPLGMRTVTDVNLARIVVIQPMVRMAIVMDMKNMPREHQRPDAMIEGFKNLSGKDAQDLGPAVIDGRKVEKFLATQDRQEFTVWADPVTRDPIRIDITVTSLGNKVTVSFTDFVLNPPIPDEMFSTDIPSGYSVTKLTLNIPKMDEGSQNLINLLRAYSQQTGGKYPPNLDEMGDFMKPMLAHPNAAPTNEEMDVVMQFQAVQHFLGKLPKNDWKYSGSGKTTADKNSIIFWCKTDAGYRGIYGNLTTRDFTSNPK